MYLQRIKYCIFVLLLGVLFHRESMAQQHETNLYQEAHRPAFHFSPPTGWMNDPNGMVYYEGEYHLFYQHYPDDKVWGPMHWGHAISTDLVHWENLPIALFPDSLGYIFSGSAVVDWQNTSGFGVNNQPPLIAIFTYHDMVGEKKGLEKIQSQGIAYSNDKGRTWTKYANNPVIPSQGIRDFRDPKVSWDIQHKQWTMTLAVQDHVEFWVSNDLKNWKHTGDFGKDVGGHGGVWECPDLFPLQVANTQETKWVLIVNINPGSPNGGSGTQYFVGDFDGKTFVLDEKFKENVANKQGVWLDYGRDNYAGVTWSDIPKTDGRRIMIGWMSNWDYANQVPTNPWRSACTLPRTLSLTTTEDGYRLLTKPVKETDLLHIATVKPYRIANQVLKSNSSLVPKLGFVPTLSEVELSFEKPQKNSLIQLELSNNKGERYLIGYDSEKNQFVSDRTKAGTNTFSPKFASTVHVAPRASKQKTVTLKVFFDVASAELFADNGATVMTDIFFPTENFTQLRLHVKGSALKIKQLTVTPLQGVWK